MRNAGNDMASCLLKRTPEKKHLFKYSPKIMFEEFQYEETSFAVRNSYVFRRKEPGLWPGLISCEVPAPITHVIATKWSLTST